MASSSSQQQRQLPAKDDDLTRIPLAGALTEDQLVGILGDRYKHNRLYTHVGPRLLLLTNPGTGASNDASKVEPQDYVDDYRNTDTKARSENLLPPHVYGLASDAYLHMRRTGLNQSIVLAGVAGSGKSQAKSDALRLFAQLRTQSKKDTRLHSQISASSTILSAFGNAATASHRDASHFGHYIEVQFDEHGRTIGAKHLNYMLDKTRVAPRPEGRIHPGERSFHVFYHLLHGMTAADERLQIQLLESVGSYNLLADGSDRVVGIDDNSRFLELCKALTLLGFKHKSQRQIFQLLSAILLLGNLQFANNTEPGGAQEAASVENREVLERVAAILGVQARHLEQALVYRTKLVKRDVVTMFMDARNAAKQRDGLMRALYSLLFSWIVEAMNGKMCREESEITSVIGVLDLAGFDSGASGRLQSMAGLAYNQMCTNFAAERVHSFFLHHMFDAVREEYDAEGIAHNLPSATPLDNSACIDLFMRPSSGLIAIMDKLANKKTSNKGGEKFIASNPVSADDDAELSAALAKAHASEGTNNRVFQVPVGQSTLGSFTIQHFAGLVTYSTSTGFTENHSDSLPADYVALFRGTNPDGRATGDEMPGSQNPFIKALFVESAVDMESHPRDAGTVIAAQERAIPRRAPSMRRPGAPRKKIRGAITQQQRAISDLLDGLSETLPWFVVCLRTSNLSAALDAAGASAPQRTWDADLVRQQVRVLGLVDVSNAKTIDYLASLPIEGFIERYRGVFDRVQATAPTPIEGKMLREILQSTSNDHSKCVRIVQQLGWAASTVAVGKSRVYVSHNVWRELEDLLRVNERTAVKPEGKKSDVRASIMSAATAGALVVGSQRPTHSAARGDDVLSHYSDDDYLNERGGPLDDESEVFDHEFKPIGEASNATPDDDDEEDEETNCRKCWVCFANGLTVWIPGGCIACCAGHKRKDQQIAWREKVALCFIIFILCCFLMFFVAILGLLICPNQDILSEGELGEYDGVTKVAKVAIRGEIYNIKDMAHHGVSSLSIWKDYGGKIGSTVDAKFPLQLSLSCPDFNLSPMASLTNYSNQYSDADVHDFRYYKYPGDDQPYDWYNKRFLPIMRAQHKAGLVGLDPNIVLSNGKNDKLLNGKQVFQCIYNNDVYDLTDYLNNGGQTMLLKPQDKDAQVSDNENVKIFDYRLEELFRLNPGQDITKKLDEIYSSSRDAALKRRSLKCLRNAFYVGTVDHRRSARCYFANYVLLASSIALSSIVLFKFLAALQLGSRPTPEDHDRFVVINVPCYTESEESMRATIDSLATMKYDDKRKLLFIICDGNIIGSGNDRPTPRIVLDILGVDPAQDPDPLSFLSLGEGTKQHNMGKVYSGLYECGGHVVPYIVVVKVGKPTERVRPGNRGKRDSQILLMRFFHKVHFNLAMTPLELEMYHQIMNVIGVNPAFYEYVMMVDADTLVFPDSLNRLVSGMIHDSKLMGICGETQLTNAKHSWITMIQVYEYFISHHLSKAFESLFGSVTCLPGCFCMYRIRAPDKNVPLLVAPAVIEEYADNKVNTLHKKNLLSLGEDRYLTTLMLKHFPNYKTKFTPDAQCTTAAPDTWAVLLSQRRRWINSTVHNLLELISLPRLCGFCCFSMRFIVFIDLFSTMVMPATVVYLGYLLYQIITSTSGLPPISLYLLAAVYVLQALIFIIKRQWQHIGWMIVYLLALPVFAFFIPLYSFWHFDDFSWGNTRIVVDKDGKKARMVADEEKFDPSTIPTKKWSDYEQELWSGANGSQIDPDSMSMVSGAGGPYSRPRSIAASRRSSPPSIYGGANGANGRMSPAGSRRVAPSISGGGDDYSAMRAAMQSPAAMSMRQPAIPQPTFEEIRQQIRVILSGVDLMSITKKQVRDQLSEHFGIDMTPYKDFITQCIEEML
ncbi:hypothetical protein GQ42DRAFT_118167 [Ramicandelaber brevisporus]|nr:hypothetical protein GQ42DRAFT_118167 [Ramicandelaber brevisporus]